MDKKGLKIYIIVVSKQEEMLWDVKSIKNSLSSSDHTHFCSKYHIYAQGPVFTSDVTQIKQGADVCSLAGTWLWGNTYLSRVGTFLVQNVKEEEKE